MAESQRGSGGSYGPPAAGSHFSATGSFSGRPASVEWTGRWSASSPDLLSLFLSFLMLEGWGDGVDPRMDCPPGIMGFHAAAVIAARETLGEGAVIDYLYQDAPEGAVGAPI